MNITTNTTTEFDVKWKGGVGRLTVGGTTGGTNITLKMYDEDAAEWLTMGTNTTFTDSTGVGHFEAPAGTRLAIVTDSGTGADIDIGLNRVK